MVRDEAFPHEDARRGGDVAASVIEIPLVFTLTTEEATGHPNSEYTHRCQITMFGERMWLPLWGKSAEDARKAAEGEVSARVRSALRAC